MNENKPEPLRSRLLAFFLILLGVLILCRHLLLGLGSPMRLALTIEHQPAIMPAVYKVYANENALNGKYSLFKMLLTNNSNVAARNVNVSFQMPGYIGWSTIARLPMILPGQSAVINCYPQLPDNIVDKTTSSEEKVNIRINGSNVSNMDEDFTLQMKGRNEFLYTCMPADEIRTNADNFDNAELLSCMITPDDPVIKYYTQKIQEKILKGEDASVTQKDEEGIRFLKGVYTATLVSHMVYSGTSGVPEHYDDVSTAVQSIRWPREVVTGKSGLCIELSLLYASVMAGAGMDPVIFLLPGHAFPGFKMNGSYYAIEATGIGGEGLGNRMSTDDAFQAGMKELQEFMQYAKAGDDRYQVLDVREAIQNGAVAVELKDDEYLRTKIDEIAQSFDSNDQNASLTAQNGAAQPGGFSSYQGSVTFSYPANWLAVARSASTMPQLKDMIADPSNMAAVSVYQFDGFSTPDAAMQAIRDYVQQSGGTIQYTSADQALGAFILYKGQTTYQNGEPANWVTALKTTGSGVVGVAVAVYASAGAQYQATLVNILNTLR